MPREGLAPASASAACKAEPGHKQSSGLFVPGEGPGHWPGAACKAGSAAAAQGPGARGVARLKQPVPRRPSQTPRPRLCCRQQPGRRCVAYRLDADSPRGNRDVEAQRSQRAASETSAAGRITRRQRCSRQLPSLSQLSRTFHGPRRHLKLPCAEPEVCTRPRTLVEPAPCHWRVTCRCPRCTRLCPIFALVATHTTRG